MLFAYPLVAALAFAAAFLAVLRWILGGTRRRLPAAPRRATRAGPAWHDGPSRRRDGASAGSWWRG